MKAIYALLAGVTLLLSACSFTTQKQEDAQTFYQETHVAMQKAKTAWDILGNPSKSKQWPQAVKDYNEGIRELASHLKKAGKNHKINEALRNSLPFHIDTSPYADKNQNWRYEAIYTAKEIDTTYRLQESVTVDGIGIPFAGVAPKGITRRGTEMLKDNGNVHTLTAILDFDRTVNGKPVLRAIPRLLHEHIEIGKHKIRQPLAANFSAPIALFWKLSDADGKELLGAFRPRKTINTMGLYFSEPYDPNKIPVLFTHGLMSGPATFANLTNRLLVDPVIRENFQFWFFGYPSGLPWTVSAYQQRQAMHELASYYSPKGSTKERNNVVMVGHSMGGLITRFNTATKPWMLMESLVNLPTATFERMNHNNWRELLSPLKLDAKAIERMHTHFFFTPPPAVTRIVFMATPHGGSSFADNWVGRLGRKLITLPSQLLKEVTNIATLSRDMILLNPGQLADELTSIRMLSPQSELIKHMSKLRPTPGIPVHSIIGDQGKGDTPDSSDGVVRYKSSHLDWSVSEKIVPSGHSVQDHPEAAIELRRILREHLAKVKGSKYVQDADARAAYPIWKKNPQAPVILKRP